MKKLCLIFVLLGWCHSAFGILSLDIQMVHKKGIDKELTLTSEIQSRERVFDKEMIQLKMKNNVTLQLKAYFTGDDDIYGPSGKIYLEGQIVNLANQSKFFISDKDSVVDLNETKEFIYKSEEEDQIVEMTVRPYLQ